MAEEKITIEPVLETALRCCIDDAKSRIERGEPVVPFSALAVGGELLMQEHSADDAATSFSLARKRVASASDVQAYVVCYDGFIEAESAISGKLTQRDCIIAEGGVPGAEYGHTIGLTYRTTDEGEVRFSKEPIYISKALNYLATSDDEFEVEVFTGAAEPDAK